MFILLQVEVGCQWLVPPHVATLPITSPEPLNIGHQICCTPDRSVRLSVCLNTTVRVKNINHGSKYLATFYLVFSVWCVIPVVQSSGGENFPIFYSSNSTF